ncbi:HD domain-containing protein [Pedobacter aquatilis]|uniref:HD domain-containing protein n=1 Tax=Pedobacter aquatilis TaxID=351343 RepID=UPI0025B5DAE6|nr:HD domain-containing protein [Pedobacter aquatilis]MDN3588520.1 HD domain-containing protein [Pedobacter aquatilis]
MKKNIDMEAYSDVLLTRVEKFVVEHFKKLDNDFQFHNLEHTLLVVEAAKLIGRAAGLTNDERFLLIIAAFLHDVGYVEKYIGHEERSAIIAKDFLSTNGLSAEQIKIIVGCILATRLPQHPVNLLEQVICDADFYHFSMVDYPAFALKLKEEWALKLGKIYNKQEWETINLQFLEEHRYFTAFGQKILQKNKDKNIAKLAKQIS